MAATTDKARFYLEQSIPELRELERKNIFSKAEISNIIKKRSDFEHKVNARGAHSADFARYAEFEINFEALRKKRAKRLGIRSSQQNVNRRVFQVLGRATTKFHGDLSLWMQYLSVCRRQKSYNKISEVLSSVIRMHPTKPEIWIYAASYFMEEQGDMVEARSYMQRGLRFCKESQEMWLTYARLELLYISKIHARQEVLGLNGKPSEQVTVGEDDEDADMIALPSLTAADLNGTGTEEQNGNQQLESLSLTPALSGAIPMAIFDAAMKYFDAKFGNRYFDMTMDFRALPCGPKIISHIVESLRAEYPSSPYTLACYIRQPVAHVSIASCEYPHALADSFARLKQVISQSPSKVLLHEIITWILDSLDGHVQEDIEQALLAILQRVLMLGQVSNILEIQGLITLFSQRASSDPNVLAVCFDVWPQDENLKAFAVRKTGRQAISVVEV